MKSGRTEAGQSLTGADVAGIVERLVKDRDAPDRIQCDNGTESFNGSFRDECLNVNWFLSMEDAQEKIEKWRLDYNNDMSYKRNPYNMDNI